ncbi:MAG: DUF3096 domain-containing protein [Pseudomonadota bacterium]
MTIHLELLPLLALIAGILVLAAPKLFRYIVAAFLIAYGIIGLFNLSI